MAENAVRELGSTLYRMCELQAEDNSPKPPQLAVDLSPLLAVIHEKVSSPALLLSVYRKHDFY